MQDFSQLSFRSHVTKFDVPLVTHSLGVHSHVCRNHRESLDCSKLRLTRTEGVSVCFTGFKHTSSNPDPVQPFPNVHHPPRTISLPLLPSSSHTDHLFPSVPNCLVGPNEPNRKSFPLRTPPSSSSLLLPRPLRDGFTQRWYTSRIS